MTIHNMYNCFTYVNLHQILLPIISIYNISTYKYYKYDYNHDIWLTMIIVNFKYFFIKLLP